MNRLEHAREVGSPKMGVSFKGSKNTSTAIQLLEMLLTHILQNKNILRLTVGVLGCCVLLTYILENKNILRLTVGVLGCCVLLTYMLENKNILRLTVGVLGCCAILNMSSVILRRQCTYL